MTCHPFQLPNGVSGFICTRGRGSRPAKCFYCRAPHSRLCDAPIAPGKTCDRKLCEQHAHSIGANLDMCPDHVAKTNTPANTNDDKPRLKFWTGNINKHRKDPGALDITIMTGGAEGRPFAPSMAIFKPAKAARDEAERLHLEAESFRHSDLAKMAALEAAANQVEQAAWVIYKRAFLAEMLVSSGRDVPPGWERDVIAAKSRGVVLHADAWAAELARERRAYLCYCASEERERCHAGLIASVLVRLGATYNGELAPPQRNPNQLSLIG